MDNSINTVMVNNNSQSLAVQPVRKSKCRHLNIKYSGYAALSFGTVCGLTGLKSVKFPYKMKVHKYSAYLAAITSFWHLGAIKQWDKIFKKGTSN